MEAWARITGTPAAANETDAVVVRRRAERTIPGLARQPVTVFAVQQPRELMPAFWSEQHAWQDGQYMARFGHRYLSVHFLRRGGGRYNRYDETLQVPVNDWLKIYAEADPVVAEQHTVETIGFGYVNAFEFPSEGFDLSRWFKLSMGVDAGQDGDVDLQEVRAAFDFFDPTLKLRTVVELVATGPEQGAVEDRVRVVTKVLADFRADEGVNFAQFDALTQCIHAAKEAAKATFFNFTKHETRVMMGAVPDAPDQPG